MTDPIADLIGDYRAFTALQRERDDGWRIVHRHADPITTARTADSVVQRP